MTSQRVSKERGEREKDMNQIREYGQKFRNNFYECITSLISIDGSSSIYLAQSFYY